MHDCPGGCGAEVEHDKLSCRQCWFRLPRPLRKAINAAWQAVDVDPAPHRAALASARRWYERNPR